ncbi:YheC/YheD family endospore coat-associated protein [Alkalihalobacterium bogoriense]|uniref:YheC/YheD family endospore coat-associated protein n=1 Tax=Alkalihalobacterium bogoriense TaxID=246272 RepID=UPI00047E6452|nr:YheC/YheD family protein [Alkalihalobacterium bogoriense]
MKLYYEQKKRSFGLLETNELLTWGNNQLPLPSLNREDALFSVQMKKQQKRIGPIVGFLTSAHKTKSFVGNRDTFIRIHKQLQQTGGLIIVFTPFGIQHDQIDGYVYNSNEEKWVRATTPLPNMIYNRVATVKQEQHEQMRKTFQWIKEKQIPMFNPHFFNKWETYRLFANNPNIKQHVPQTIKITDKARFEHFIQTNQTTYLKPIYGNKGSGIMLLQLNLDETITLRTNQFQRKLKSLQQTWEKLSPLFKKNDFILQQAISLPTYQNRPYDFRVHVQFHSNQWHLTGIGIRCAGTESITTHVPQGGQILSLSQIDSTLDKAQVALIAKQVAGVLQHEYGNIGEFSMDIGQDKQGHYWIFEVNAKPMIFDEPKIQQKGLQNLITLFYEQSLFLQEE